MTAGKQKKWHLSQAKKNCPSTESFFVVNDQVVTIRIYAKSLKITDVQVYASTTDAVKVSMSALKNLKQVLTLLTYWAISMQMLAAKQKQDTLAALDLGRKTMIV